MIKKIKSCIFSLLLLIVLTACNSSSTSETTAVCTLDDKTNETSITETITYKEDNISKIVEVNKGKAINLDDKTKNELDDEIVKYNATTGIKASYELKDDILTTSIEVDYTKVDLNKLRELGIIESSDKDNVTAISFSKTKTGFEKEGFTCK
ncbi:MAG: DUF1307 domain-containing protein [Erysipelotrichaceae bacterium]